ncbi:MAG: 30S ribosomal protein S3ae [Candidatus Caldarchaeum sp.]|nr:30S ribosomal protein S3ae [Candidatus Caldarchaeum sp.]
MSKKASEQKKPKKTYETYSPVYFGGRWLGSTMADDPSKLIGRVLRTSLYALTDDFSKQYMQLKFRIVEVKDSVCNTIFYGHEYGREYLRSLVKRGTNKIEYIFDVKTKDGFVIRVYPVVFTVSRISTAKRKAIRKIMKQVLDEAASNLTHDQLAQELVIGKTASDIYNLVKKIVLPRHVGVYKSKIIKLGTFQTVSAVQPQG